MNNAETSSFNFRLTPNGLDVDCLDNGKKLLLPWLWLRDHCRAEHSFNHETGQRKQTPTELDTAISANSLEWIQGENELAIQWNNGEPNGRYPAEFFANLAADSGAIGEEFIAPKLWDNGNVAAAIAPANNAMMEMWLMLSLFRKIWSMQG